MRILLLEDDPALGAAIAEHLRAGGHELTHVTRREAAWAALEAGNPDLLLIDLRLPDGSGLDLLGQLRGRGDDRPVVIITARDQVGDRIAGLNAGADDYLVKPFDLHELTARSSRGERLACAEGQVLLDLAGRQAEADGAPVPLTGREWAILDLLARRPGAFVPRARMEEALAAAGADAGSNALEVHISRIRRKLGHEVIETLRGVGSRLRR